MRVSYNNLLKDAILQATNENINRSISNVVHNFLKLAFYATGNSSVITAILDTTYDIDHIAFDYHNINAMTIRFYDNLDILIDTEIITVANNCNFHYFDTIEDVKKIVITVSTLATLLYIGGISIGEYFELPNFTQAHGGELKITDTDYKSSGGQKTGNTKFCPLTKGLNFSNISNDDKNNIITYIRYVQKSIPHFIDMYPDAQNRNPPFYGSCEMTSIPIPKRRISDWEWDLSITYEECR